MSKKHKDITPIQVFGPCLTWGFGFTSGSSFFIPSFVREVLLTIPHDRHLPSIHKDWVPYDGSLSTPEVPAGWADTWVNTLTVPQAIAALGIIEGVVDESCLGSGVRGYVSLLWDSLSILEKSMDLPRNFIFDWTPESWQKVLDYSILHDMMILSADRTKVLFDEAFTSRGNKKQPSAERLIAWSNPESIISVAIDEFRKYGNEDRLSFTSSILLEFSNESVMSAFENLADRAVPEVISFLGILEYLDVSQKAIQNLIDRLRKNLTPAVFQAVSSYLGNCAIQRP